MDTCPRNNKVYNVRKFKRVLLVDDDDSALFVAKKVLMRMEVAEDVATAVNGLEGFLAVKAACGGPAEEFPGLILVDLKMPVMSGFKMIEAMGGLPLPSKPLVVVLTSSENPIDRERARMLQADGYLVKPIRPESIERLLEGLPA
ncbi:response regulator [Rufibacter roseolus]|uniref:response regulator n=1 Tax=Rufibacter roseolus TaxID=2817375 RepID=UPI001B3108B3|nr:response regulator [Rufibacter roseolus]